MGLGDGVGDGVGLALWVAGALRPGDGPLGPIPAGEGPHAAITIRTGRSVAGRGNASRGPTSASIGRRAWNLLVDPI